MTATLTAEQKAQEVVSRLVNSGWQPPGPEYSGEIKEAWRAIAADLQEWRAESDDETFLLEEIGQLKYEQEQEIKLLVAWIADLQSGLRVNCVYCGYNYGPKKSTSVSMSQVLYDHIKVCPKHPLQLVYKAFEPVKDWYDGGEEIVEPPLHEMLIDAVADLISDRGDALRLVKFLHDIRGKLPEVMHNHEFIRWIRDEVDRLDDELKS